MVYDSADVQRYLSGADFPASATHLAALADREGAPEQMQAALRSFGNRLFEGTTQVAEAVTRYSGQTKENTSGVRAGADTAVKERIMRYDEFLANVRDRSDLTDRDHAEQATQAVLDVLGQRLSGGEAADLATQLPEQLQPVLTTHSGDAEGFELDEFLDRVAQREARGCGVEAARAHASAVFSTLANSVPTDELDDFRSQLPPGYDTLLH